jgi:tripartite-type tricarboxylate transporter receptor subunit TctC
MTNTFRTSRRAVMTALAAAALGQSPAALAQASNDYPERPIKILVPFPPGQASDIMARLFGDRIAQTLGQPVVVENRVGAGGNIGTEAGARAAGDGYTLTLATAALPISTHIYKLNFDPATDFAPVAQFTVTPLVLVMNPKLAFKTVAELIAYAKQHPGKLTFASSGPGTSHHLAGEMFKVQAGIDVLHVPYRGSASAHTDLMGGIVDIMFDNIMAVGPHIKAGKLQALAVTTKNRAPTLAQTPTMAQAGLPAFEAVAWFGLLAPKSTPTPIVAKLNGAVQSALAQPDIQKRLADMGAQGMPGTPAAFQSFFLADIKKWEPVVRQANVKLD